MASHKVDLTLDVTDALPPAVTQGQRLHIAAWVFIPDRPALQGGRPTTIALLHGGTYDKRYFHFEVPGRAGYSAAERLAELGYIVILTDFLGGGESSRTTNRMRVTRHVAALANHAALEQVYERLRRGLLSPDLQPVAAFTKVGGGHSMGAMITITQQAQSRTFDRLLVLGFTGIGVHILRDGEFINAPLDIDETESDYVTMDRLLLRPTFHWDDVADEVQAADDDLVSPLPYILRVEASRPGVVAADCAKIETPVLIALGERDISPDPYREPSFYTASSDVTLYILPRAGHCHAFADTRSELLDQIHGWIQGLVPSSQA